MKIETKFNFGDVVHNIWYGQKREWVACGFCSGSGVLTGANNKTIQCPECYGRKGRSIITNNEYSIQGTLTVGEIRVRVRCEYDDNGTGGAFDNYGPQKEEFEETYMCYETGIGSGTLHNSEVLFSNEEDAQAECDRLNKLEQ